MRRLKSATTLGPAVDLEMVYTAEEGTHLIINRESP